MGDSKLEEASKRISSVSEESTASTQADSEAVSAVEVSKGPETVKRTRQTSTLQSTRDTVEAELPAVYLTGQKIIDSKKVTYFRKKLVEDSDETKDVKLKIEMLQSFLSNPMPPFGVNEEDEKRYSKELEAVKLAISLLYNKLISSMDVWLSKKRKLSDYSKERFEMITSLRQKVLEEEAMFSRSLDDYRTRNLGRSTSADAQPLSWIDMLRFERAEKIDLDDPSVTHEMTGGATSNVFKITKAGKTRYFKEEEDTLTGDPMEISKKIAKKMPDLPPELISGFRSALSADCDLYQDDEHGLRRLLRAFFDRFENETDPWNHPAERYFGSIEDFIKTVPRNQREAFSLYYSHFYKAVLQQSISVKYAKMAPGSNLSRRNVATSRLASMLGIGDIIAESRTAVVKKNGKTMRGNLMEDTQGMTGSKLRRLPEAVHGITYSEEAEDQLICLQVFDFLCGQVDRHHGNFHLNTRLSDNGGLIVTGIKGIDNDMAFGKMSFETANRGVKQLIPLDEITLSALPEKFRDAILTMDGSFMNLMLMDLLDKDELRFLEDRLEGLKNMIREAQHSIEKLVEGLPGIHREIEADRQIRKIQYFKTLKSLPQDDSFGFLFDRRFLTDDRTLERRKNRRMAVIGREYARKKNIGGVTA